MNKIKQTKLKKERVPRTFLDYPSVKKLRELAKSPFDLTSLTPKRVQEYVALSSSFKLLYGTERVDRTVMEGLQELAQESQALKKMSAMQEGEVVNQIENYPSEDRAALHTATRDFFTDPRPSPDAKEAAKEARREIDKLRAFMERVDSDEKFSQMIMIGIGGSDLGPRANYHALEYLKKPGREVFFVSNVDPDDAALVLRQADLEKCLVLVVSKSGKTLETAVNEEFIKSGFREQGLNPKDHFISITTPGSPLDNPENYLESFYVWDWVGGRYSTTSAVGGVMLSFAFGFDAFWQFLEGAHAMDQAALNPDLNKNIPLLTALLGIWNRNFLGYPTVALIPYSQALSRYPAHIQQVEMESNGKSVDRFGQFVDFDTGAVIWGEPGTNAQHSFFQMIHQGTSVIPVSMVGFTNNQCGQDLLYEGTTSQQKLLANLFAQVIALAVGQKSDNPNTVFPGNRPTHILLGEQLNPYSLGALLALYEHQVAFRGFIWGINSFDQEGVQLGKVLAGKIVDCFAAQNGKASKGESYPIGDAFISSLMV
jgi:glucose-6-phosphate isomerase